MKKVPKILGLIVGFIFCLATNTLADNPEQWRYSKEVTYENKEGVKAFFLDEEVYSYAKKDLSDIRLINEKNEYVPYYIYNGFINQNTKEYVEYASQEILYYMKENDYYTDYKIKPINENTDIIGNIIVLEVPKDSFYKEVKVLASHDNKSWENIQTDIIYNINGQSKFHIPLDGNYKYAYYRIISLNDMGEVPISRLTLIYDHTEETYEQYKKSKTMDYKVEVDKEAKETIVTVHNKDGLRMNNIKLKSNDDFNRDYQIYLVNEVGERIQQMTQGTIYKFSLEEFKIENMDISLRETMGEFIAPEYLQLVIKDRDDKPINIEAVEIEYHVDKIVFKTNDSKEIKLLYGNELAQKPSYDISAYIVEMEQSNQERAQLLGLALREVEGLKDEKSFDFKWILNASVVVISGLLVIVILKKK